MSENHNEKNSETKHTGQGLTDRIQPQEAAPGKENKPYPKPAAAKEVKTIGILTSGEDAPGMNAAIRAIVRTALSYDRKVIGIRRGFEGLIEKDCFEFTARAVAETVQKGGTILFAADCPRFLEVEGQELAASCCKDMGLDALVVIGGNGTLNGAKELVGRGINVIGIPGTIELDVDCTEYTIGFDTAVNTAMNAIDKIRDTSTSHERCCIVEVAGKTSGFNALWCGIANGAENVLMAETFDHNEERIISEIINKKKIGKRLHIIINSSSIGGSNSMAKRIEFATGLETRATILGHLQRGGSPTCKDRVYASAMGAKAVEVLQAGGRNRIIAYHNGAFVDFDFEEALSMKKTLDPYMIEMAKKLSR